MSSLDHFYDVVIIMWICVAIVWICTLYVKRTGGPVTYFGMIALAVLFLLSLAVIIVSWIYLVSLSISGILAR